MLWGLRVLLRFYFYRGKKEGKALYSRERPRSGKPYIVKRFHKFLKHNRLTCLCTVTSSVRNGKDITE